MSRNTKKEPLTPINHSSIIDGFGELHDSANYMPFDSYCGVCDKQIHVSPAAQKYLLEVKQIPVKFLKRGAIYCDECRDRRSRINYLRKGDKWLEVENGKEELNQLQNEESRLEAGSSNRYLDAKWPY